MKKKFAALACTLLAAALLAQTKPKPGDVSVRLVNDRRTNGSFSELMITLDLPAVSATDVAASRVLVKTAVDDSGRDLIDPKGGEPSLEPNSRGMASGDKTTPTSVVVTLKNPDRKAVAVKEVSGEIELYMPGRDPNSVAEIPSFLSTSGKPLAHRALKANLVDITLVNPAQLEAERKRLGEAKRKQAKESGYEGGDLEAIVKSYLENLLNLDEGELLLRVKDPNKRLQEIAYVTAAGETKRVSMHDREGFTVISTWGEKPQADWKLRVSMKTAKNIVRQPFKLTNVPLP